MNTERNKWNRKLLPPLAVLLTALLLLSLVMPSLGTRATGLANEARQASQTVTARAQGSTGEDVPLAGAEGWAQVSVEVSGAPDGAVVSSVRAKYHVVYPEASDLEVQLLTSGAEASYTLWNRESAEGTVLTQSTDEITAFRGAPVNSTWSLAVQGGGAEGYIDDFGVVVYYETDMPVLHVEGEGPPGTPGFLRLPEGATPASPPPDGDEKPSGEGSSVVPQHVPPGARIIKMEDFEGDFPNDLWRVYGEPHWDDVGCDPCGGDWSAWPAAGGAGGIDPCAGNDYPNSMEAWMIYGPFDLSNAWDAGTEFTMWRDIEPDYDWVFFGVSADGTNFTGLLWDDYAPCTLYNITYSDWVGDPSVWVAWVFHSDSSVTEKGPWVDDIVIGKNDTCATVKIDPPDQTVNSGRSFTINIVVENAIDLGAFEFELTYDHICVQATGATLGPFLGSTGRSVADVGPLVEVGSVTYGAFSWGASPGPSGDGVLATVTFQAGSNECASVLHLQNVSLVDTAGNPQCVSTEDGLVHLKGCPDPDCPADINCDGVTNILDIQLCAIRWGCQCEDPCYWAACDLDDDCDIDIMDIIRLASQWNIVCVPSPVSIEPTNP